MINMKKEGKIKGKVKNRITGLRQKKVRSFSLMASFLRDPFLFKIASLYI